MMFLFQNVLSLISRPLKTRELIEIPSRKFEDLLGRRRWKNKTEELRWRNIYIELFSNDIRILRYLRDKLILRQFLLLLICRVLISFLNFVEDKLIFNKS